MAGWSWLRLQETRNVTLYSLCFSRRAAEASSVEQFLVYFGGCECDTFPLCGGLRNWPAPAAQPRLPEYSKPRHLQTFKLTQYMHFPVTLHLFKKQLLRNQYSVVIYLFMLLFSYIKQNEWWLHLSLSKIMRLWFEALIMMIGHFWVLFCMLQCVLQWVFTVTKVHVAVIVRIWYYITFTLHGQGHKQRG